MKAKPRIATITVNGKDRNSYLSLIQPGQTPGTIGIPLGYGRTKGGKVADGSGAKCISIVGMVNGSLNYQCTRCEVQDYRRRLSDRTDADAQHLHGSSDCDSGNYA